MKVLYPLVATLLLCLSAAADSPRVSLTVDTNGVVLAPLGFWQNNTKALSNAVSTIEASKNTNSVWPVAGANVSTSTNGTLVMINADVSHAEVNSASNAVYESSVAVIGVVGGNLTNAINATSNALMIINAASSNALATASAALGANLTNNVNTTSNALMSTTQSRINASSNSLAALSATLGLNFTNYVNTVSNTLTGISGGVGSGVTNIINYTSNALLATVQFSINSSSNSLAALLQDSINVTSNILQGAISAGGASLLQVTGVVNTTSGVIGTNGIDLTMKFSATGTNAIQSIAPTATKLDTNNATAFKLTVNDGTTGSATIIRPDGSYTNYFGTTDTARGFALSNALKYAQAKDVVKISPGLFSITGTNGQFVVPAGITVQGSGDSTVVTKSLLATNSRYSIVFMNSNSTLRDLCVSNSVVTTPTKTFDLAIDWDVSGSHAGSFLLFKNITVYSDTDAMNSPASGFQILVEDSRFYSLYDGPNCSGDANGGAWEFRRCNFNAIGGSGSGDNITRSFVASQGGVVSVYNSTFTAIPSGAASAQVAAVGSSDSGTLSIYNSAIVYSNSIAGTYGVHQSGAGINLFNCSIQCLGTHTNDYGDDSEDASHDIILNTTGSGANGAIIFGDATPPAQDASRAINLNASQISTGTILDARIAANITRTNNVNGPLRTNAFGLVECFTNNTPLWNVPDGSHCWTTSGQEWSRTNGAWVAINITGTGTGGSGTVTSIDVAQQGYTSSGAITGSGTVTLTQSADKNHLGFSETNINKLAATNTAIVGGPFIDPTNAFQVNTLATSKALAVSTNGVLSANGNGVTNLNPNTAFPTPMVDFSGANQSSQYLIMNGSTNPVSTLNGNLWTNLNVWDTTTNVLSGTLFPLGTNGATVTGSDVHYTGLQNLPAQGIERWGQQVIVATADITVTNPVAWRASDGLHSRTLTNGNSLTIAVDVWGGWFTNSFWVQDWFPTP